MEMDEVTRPSERELQTNSRSRSALLHVLRKRRAPRLADLEHKAHALPTWCSVTEASEASGARRPKRKRVAEEEEAEEAEAEAAEVEVEVAGEANPALKWPCARCGQKTHRSSECPSQLEGCNYCGQVGHTTRRCTFGAKRSERFLFCEALRPRLGCFWRRFLVPLTRGDATTFQASAPRGGRVDVGLRCLSAGLFRSQGLRRNTQVCLSFEASGHVLEVSGALVRGLVPDEPRLAERVEAALASERQLPDPKEDPEAWCTSPLRGMELRARSSQAALKAMLKAKEGRIALLILDADGEPISQVLKQQRDLQGLVVLVGDHRGLSAEMLSAYEEVARAAEVEVVRASLGRTTLLGSHAIVILQHYLDEHLHCCAEASRLRPRAVKKKPRSGRGRAACFVAVDTEMKVRNVGIQYFSLDPGLRFNFFLLWLFGGPWQSGSQDRKSVTAGSFGELNGVQTGDVLVAAGRVEDLQALEKLELEAFKSLLKGRPLTLAFHSEASPGSTYEILADATVSKMGIAFRGMPPGALPVKSVGEGFGKERGVRAGDVLLQVGKDELASLEGMSADSFKNLLKERPLRMQFQSGGGSLSEPNSPAITPRTLEAQQVAEHPREAAEQTAEAPSVVSGVPAEPAAAAAVPAVQAASSERAEGSTYEILADASVSKMGIAFRGMPPGALPVKSVGEGFGKEHGVRAGDVLLQVGKDELASLEGMSADSFKNLLKERPLRMQFQSGGGSLSEPSTPAITPRKLEAQQAAEHPREAAEHTAEAPAVASGVPAAEPAATAAVPAAQAAGSERAEGSTYEILADASVSKMGIAFRGMPPGALPVKSVGEGFGKEHGVRAGDVLLQVGKDELASLEGMSADSFKHLLKERPLRMQFQSGGGSLSGPSSAVTTPRTSERNPAPESQREAAEHTAEAPAVASGVPAAEPAAAAAVPAVQAAGSERAEGSTYEILADASVSKMGIAFRGMPPGALPVKSVGEGFGKEHGVRAGDVLLQVGKDELASLEGMSADSFKNLLKERPLRMQFQSGGGSLSGPSSAVTTPRTSERNQAAESQREAAEHAAEAPKVASGVPAAEPAAAAAVPAVQAAGSERAEGSTYEILADASVSKMGIAFRGMPPGALPVKSVGEGFGKEHGVRAADVLLQVGKDELASLEGMSADSFKNLLKERPLRMQFQSGGGSLSETHSPAITPRALETQQVAEHPREAAEHTAEVPAVASGVPAAEPAAAAAIPAVQAAGSERAEGSTYEILADASVSKMGIAFRGMPPGALPVKSVGEGFGKEHGVRAGDVLLQVGKDELASLEGMSADSFKNLLKERPLRMQFQSGGGSLSEPSTPAITPRKLEAQQAAEHPREAAEHTAEVPAVASGVPAAEPAAAAAVPAVQAAGSERAEGSTYEILADASVSKMGIAFRGMPPGALPVKSVGEGFGKERGVRAGDVLLQVGKDELASLEGMSADSFKNLLKERPLRMQFQSGGGSLSEPSTPAITPRKLEAQQAAEHPREAAEHTAEVPAVASGVPAAEPAAAAAIPAVQAAGSERAEGSTYEILADASVSKMGIAFRGMPPGALPVKSVGEGFGKEHGVRAGDVLLQVGKDELASLEGMSADSFKNLLKERPLRMQFQSGGGSLSEPSTPAITPRTLEAQQAAEAVVSGAMPAAEPRAVPPAEERG
ncbi:unnamed protein product [Effrenium voratum]|uniref:CCHC-type domain-containing protein n=1 Tax=Effrenium voratum TaxID=2562239 RepID=A0AA36MU92_9DINO|nr:unnamed protein product [Effrenium voratum]